MDHFNMYNPFCIIADFAEIIVDVLNENEEITRRQIAKERRLKEKQKAERRAAEHRLWEEITEEEHKNPEEFRVLPYGWSPFGIVL